MANKDPNADFVGIWSRGIIDIRSERDFGIFYMWLNKSKSKGFCFEDLGYSDVTDFKASSNEVSFKKDYCDKAWMSGASPHTVEYLGRSNNCGRSYCGNWETKTDSGIFVMGQGIEENLFQKMVTRCHVKAFGQRVIDSRESFPYSPLHEALRNP